jgi:cytochrome c
MLHPVRVTVAILSLGILLSACAEGGDGASAAGSSTAAATSPADLQALLAAADPDKGQVLFLQCRACHSLEAGGANKVGPNLHGVFGRKAGMAPGYAYSEALTQASIVWSAETLNQWLARPSEFLPGNRMVFVGIRKPEDRANLIAYLQRETGAK